MLGFQGQLLPPEQHLPYGAADRGRTRQRSGPPADNGSSGFANGAVACTVDGGPPAAPGFAGSSRVPRSASAPPGRMQQGPAGQADGQVLAQLQRTQQELQASLLSHVLSRELLGVWGTLLRVDRTALHWVSRLMLSWICPC